MTERFWTIVPEKTQCGKIGAADEGFYYSSAKIFLYNLQSAIMKRIFCDNTREISHKIFRWEKTPEGHSWASSITIALALRGHCAELHHPSVLFPPSICVVSSWHCVTCSCTLDCCWTLSASPPPATLPLSRFSLVELQPLIKSIYLGNWVSALMCFPNDPQASSFIAFLLRNQRCRLDL